MAIALDQFISKIMGDQTFSVNDENMKEGNTYQVHGQISIRNSWLE